MTTNQSNIVSDRSVLDLVRRLGLDIIADRYEPIKPVGSSFGGSSFIGLDKETGSKIFIKYLICPRGSLERAKFLTERDALKLLNQHPYNVSPKLLWFEEFPDLLTDVIVTEFVKGENLVSWLESSGSLPIDDRLGMFHRIVFAFSHATTFYQHRDPHPGNIIVLPNELAKMGPKIDDSEVDPGIRIVDWGEALPVLLGNFDDEPDHNFIMLRGAPTSIGGSITSLPPEVFSPWIRNSSFSGVYESWGIGLLLYRLLTGQTPPRVESLGHYVEQLHDGSLQRWINEQVNNVMTLDIPGGLIIPRLLGLLLQISPESRAKLSYVGRILWDVRYEGLSINQSQALGTYLSNPHEYEPLRGWKFSGYNDYD
jgi:serine/threonine protein kinase